MKFDITLDRPRWETAHVTIEAKDEDEATRLAECLPDEQLERLEWTPDNQSDRYEVTEVEPLDDE